MKIFNFLGEVLVDVPSENLSEADLREADLRWADLRWANLCRANLCRADLRGADLRRANLSEADLREADLRWANLCRANLCRADLREADLSEADLRGANPRRANLREADLREADLRGADLPSPTMLLLASWGKCSDDLTVDLMRYDAENHEHPETFNVWKDTGKCPYVESQFTRCANFIERRDLWSADVLSKPAKSALALAKMLIAEHCKNE